MLARVRAGSRARCGATTLVIVLSLLAVVACQSGSEYTARFVRYTALPDGTRAAVVAPSAIGSSSEEQIVSTGLDDLKPGDEVEIRPTGKDWDQPQWRPAAEIVGRVGD